MVPVPVVRHRQKAQLPRLPDYYPAWHSRLKGCYVLKLSEWGACKRLFKERGMRTFADGLRYYNDLDVAPGLEALERMRAFYTEKGIDILKDAVSIPGVSLHYLLRGAVERGAELYSPGKEAYEMLKGVVVEGRASCSRGTTKSGSRRSGHIRQRNRVFASASLVTTPMPSTCRRCWRKCPAGRKRLFTTRAVGLLEPRRISHKGSKTDLVPIR